jgi:hypothetical protein
MFGWYTRKLKIINQTLIGTLIGKGLPSLSYTDPKLEERKGITQKRTAFQYMRSVL